MQHTHAHKHTHTHTYIYFYFTYIDAVLFNVLYIKESWKNYHRFQKQY